jgi:hypothetical protein
MMRWFCHTHTYTKVRAPIALEAETVPVTAGLHHGNVGAFSFHFVNLIIVLHLSDKKVFGVAFQEQKHSGTRASGGNANLACYRTQQEISQIRTGQDNPNTIT